MRENTLKASNETQKKITKFLFIIYLLVLIWIILFKMSFSIQDLPRFRGINLIPFKGTAIVNNTLDYSEILNNILIFVPFGLYLSMLKPHESFLKKITPIAIVSLLFESIQYIFAIGGTDITDFIGNTLGGITGIAIYFVAHKVFKKQTIKIANTLATIGTVGVLTLLLMLILGNL